MKYNLIQFAFLSFCCSFASAQEPAPTFELGDSWTYSYQQDSVSQPAYTETVNAIDASTVDLLVENAEGRKSISTYDQKLHRYLIRYALTEDGRRGRVRSDFSQNQAPIRFPFLVGDEWSVLCHYQVNGSPITQEFQAKVIGREQIRTPAGAFDAYRIELTGYWWNEESISMGKGRQFETYWYVPAVKRYVRREIKSYGLSIAKMWTNLGYSRTDELVAFHLSSK